MPQPTFRLATVLAYRESLLALAVQGLARVEVAAHTVAQALTQLVQEQRALLGASTSEQERTAADLWLLVDYLNLLEQREHSLRTELAQLQEQLARARELVLERHRAVDVLNRLKERQLILARQELARQEQRLIDEMTGTRAFQYPINQEGVS